MNNQTENKLALKKELIVRIQNLFETSISKENAFYDFHLYYDYKDEKFFFTEKPSCGVYRFTPPTISGTLYISSAWEDDCSWDEHETDEDSEYFFQDIEHYRYYRAEFFNEYVIEYEIRNTQCNDIKELFFYNNKESRITKVKHLINQQ